MGSLQAVAGGSVETMGAAYQYRTSKAALNMAMLILSKELAPRGISVVMIAGMPEEITAEIAGKARKHEVLVNVEDDKKYCDYHVPAIVRRGDFLLTVSTGGKSPRLSLRLRQELEKLFPAKWEKKLNELELLRNKWRKNGDDIL